MEKIQALEQLETGNHTESLEKTETWEKTEVSERTLKIKLLPNDEQQQLIDRICEAYIEIVNGLVEKLVKAENSTLITVQDIPFNFPAGVKNHCIQDVYSIYNKFLANPRKGFAVIKKPCCKWEKGEVTFMGGDMVAFPIFEGGKNLLMKAVIPPQYRIRLAEGFESMKIHKKSIKYIGTISVIDEIAEMYEDES